MGRWPVELGKYQVQCVTPGDAITILNWCDSQAAGTMAPEDPTIGNLQRRNGKCGLFADSSTHRETRDTCGWAAR